MTDVSFADILFILFICVVIYGILMMVNRSRKTATAKGEEPEEKLKKAADDD